MSKRGSTKTSRTNASSAKKPVTKRTRPSRSLVRTVPITNTVQMKLGTEKYLQPLFEYYELDLLEGMEHAFSTTLLRDQFYAGWAHVWRDKTDGEFYLKITTPNPNDDVRGYTDVIPRYLKAVEVARNAFDKAVALPQVIADTSIQNANLRFLPPFGLSMLKAGSVLLLHYPPDETLDYKDYLHSRTTKRWESLLVCNGCPGPDHPLLESIVDVYPVTADGGSGGSAAVDKLCANVKSEMADYANQMLSLLLQQEDFPGSGVTQPLVALGSKVRDWFFYNTHLKAQIEKQLGDLKRPQDIAIHSTFYLEFKPGVRTPVLILDHPSNYYRGTPANRVEQVRKDLIGARWQVQMAANPMADPKEILTAASVYWNSPRMKDDFDRIVRDQETQFKNIHKPDEC